MQKQNGQISAPHRPSYHDRDATKCSGFSNSPWTGCTLPERKLRSEDVCLARPTSGGRWERCVQGGGNSEGKQSLRRAAAVSHSR
jgi:hypothetical protein